MRKIFYLLLVLSLLAACSNQDDVEVTSEKVPLTLTVNDCITRSIITGKTMLDGSELGVFATNANSYTTDTNVKATVNGNNCELASNIYLTDANKYVYAYYPYNANCSNANSIPFDAKAQNDVLYGYGISGIDENYFNTNYSKANLKMKHAMARITLAISNVDTTKITVTSAFLSGAGCTGTIDLVNQKISINSTGDVTTDFTPFTLTAEPQTIDILVVPTSKAKDVYISLGILDGSSKTKYYAAMVNGNSDYWAAGKHYTYNIEFTKSNKLMVSETSIEPWHDNEQEKVTITDDNLLNK